VQRPSGDPHRTRLRVDHRTSPATACERLVLREGRLHDSLAVAATEPRCSAALPVPSRSGPRVLLLRCR
jgi:hypothetical protein